MQIIGISFLPHAAPTRTRAITPPRTPLEQELVSLLQSVLEIPEIGIDDHFIELGGDSLRATQFLSRVRAQLGISLSFSDLYQEPTIRGVAQRIQETQHAARPLLPAIERRADSSSIPLSFSQERMWFIHELAPENTAYHVQITVRLRGALDVNALVYAFDELTRRHEILRTTFPKRDGAPVQHIAAHTPFRIACADLQNFPDAERLTRAMEFVTRDAQQSFDLENGPLLRVHLYKLAPAEHILLLVMHHILCDAWSLGVMMRELTELYRAHSRGASASLPALPIQFSDYAVWQRAWLQGDALEAELAYWRRQLTGAPPLELPTDHPRPALQTYRGSSASAALDAELHARLSEICQRANGTLAMLFLAAFFVLLRRYTAQDDLVVGMPIANRHHDATEQLIGAFVNTLALRANVSDNPTFAEFLQRVRATALDAYAHQDMPFAKLVADLNPPRNLQQAPLVQVMFNVINVPMPLLGFADMETDLIEWDRGAAQFDLTLTITDLPQLKRLTLEYNRDLFEPETMARCLEHYQTLLQSIATNPDVCLAELEILPERERAQLRAWNETAREIPNASLAEWFESQVKRTPHALALRDGERTIPYAELNARANQLARVLQSGGVTAETRVVVGMERSIEMVIAQLAILKAGGAYVPLDMTHPQTRLDFILNDTQAPIILTQQKHRARFQKQSPVSNLQSPRVIALDADWERIARARDANLNLSIALDDAAYVIYTSGSTGNPKGVMGLQRGAVNVMHWLWREFPFRAHDVCCLKTAPGFVDAMWETFAPLLMGVPLVIFDNATVQDLNAFVNALAQHRVTRVVLVPSLLRALLDTQTNLRERLPHLEYWIAGGEALTPELVRAFYEKFPERALLNFYGATEASANSTWFDTRAMNSHHSVPIGRPIDNTQTYILDAQRNPVPIGVVGELYIGGAGIARGYLNQPELTREKFISLPNLESPVSGLQSLYRTGDLARFLPDGNIEYRGRADSQIKIRGMRVELSEIENAIRETSNVNEAIVVAQAEELSGARLIAYVTPARVDVKSLRAQLQQKLPPHMIPSAFVTLDELPHNSSGKVDRRALAERPIERTHSERVLTRPRDEIERALVPIWERALNVQPLGVDDDFFELGGHSLLAVRVFAEMQQTLGATLPITALFRAPTIAGLANELRAAGVRAPWSPLAPIQIHGTRPPFFCVHGLGGGVIGYVSLARHLGNAQPFYGLQAFGVEAGQIPDATIEQMAARYLDAMRHVQPHGPYHLGGYSYGGTVAFEMAQQLRAQGQAVALLAMFDTPAPNAEYWRVKFNAEFFKGFARNLPAWWNDYARLAAREQWGRVVRQTRSRWNTPRGENGKSANVDLRHYVDNIQAVPPERVDLMRAELAAFAHYHPKFYDGRVTVFRAPRHPLWCSYDDALGWRSLAREVEVRLIAGAHRNLLEEPHVQVLAQELNASLLYNGTAIAEY